MSAVLVCRRCGRRHPEGTEWCPCGAYLAFEGEREEVPDPAPTPTPAPEATPPAGTAPAPAGAGTPGAGRSGTAPAGPGLPGAGQGAPSRDPAAGAATPGALAAEPGTPSRSAPPTVPVDAGAAPRATGPAPVEAVLPDAPITRSDGPTAEEASPPPAAPGDVACPVCATPNGPTLRFCRRCGAELSAAPAPPPAATPEPPAERRPSWWRRLAGRRPAAVDRELQRAATTGRLPSADRLPGLATRTRAIRIGGVTLTAAAALALLGPWRGDVVDGVAGLLPVDRHEVVSVAGAATLPPEAEAPGEGAANAVDDVANRGWATRWTVAGDGLGAVPAEAACVGAGSTSSSLLLQFAEPVDVDRVQVLPGRFADDPNRAAHRRPRVLELAWSDGSCDHVEVDDAGELQARDVAARDVTTMEVRVLGVYAGDGVGPSVGIAEIVVEQEG